MRSRWTLWCALAASLAPCACQSNRTAAVPAEATPANDDERTFYALGYLTGDRLRDLNMSPREAALLARGLSDAVTNAGRLADPEAYATRIRDMQRARRIARMSQGRQQSARLLDEATRAQGAVVMPSGAVVREVHPGTGALPGLMQYVTLNYRGTLVDGTEFDSSDANHGPATFILNNAMPCLAQTLQHVHVGARARIVCPPETAYGENPRRRVPPDATLIFEVDVLSVDSEAPPAPDGGAAAGQSVPLMLRPQVE